MNLDRKAVVPGEPRLHPGRRTSLGFVEGSDMVTGQVLVVDGGLGIAG
jgi:hypothetical protein